MKINCYAATKKKGAWGLETYIYLIFPCWQDRDSAFSWSLIHCVLKCYELNTTRMGIPLNAVEKPGISYCWRSIVRGFQAIKAGMIWRVGSKINI
jgi:hypothetical protein